MAMLYSDKTNNETNSETGSINLIFVTSIALSDNDK